MSILVCGGAGYIGSHTVKELIGKYNVVVLDNLKSGTCAKNYSDYKLQFHSYVIRTQQTRRCWVLFCINM